jgi:hypothetical protein
LTCSATSVEQGETITFTYSTPQATVNPTNWVGLYSDPGNGPVDQKYVGPSTTWQYVTLASGTVPFGSGSLAPGAYIASYRYNDGYTWLAEPADRASSRVRRASGSTRAARSGLPTPAMTGCRRSPATAGW